MDYKQLVKIESWGKNKLGIEINVGGDNLPDLKDKDIWYAGNNAIDSITAAIRLAMAKVDPETLVATKRNTKLLKLFPEKIFVKELPNGYCNDWCCQHLPWFEVTIKIGVFIIGWRKRVIQLDWSGTLNDSDADTLFPDEDTTKYGRSIHAWSEDKAKRYIERIILTCKGGYLNE